MLRLQLDFFDFEFHNWVVNACNALWLLVLVAGNVCAQTSVDVFGSEIWLVRPISGMPFVASLPKGGAVRTRDVPKASPPDGSSVWGQDLTLDDKWADIIRLQYVVGRDPVALDGRRKPWGKPMSKTRDGLRTLEVGYNDGRTPDGGELAEVHYIIEIGPKKFVELLLQCRKDSVSLYAPYFARIRDSLRPVKDKTSKKNDKSKG